MALSAKPLVIQKLKKTYHLKSGKNIEALKGISFSVEAGEIFGLLGPNGAGKTSAISMITTLEKPTDGDVLIFGQSVQKDPQYTKKQIGIVPQEIVTQGFFDLEEILAFHSGYYGVRKNKERIDYLLDRLGLYPHKKKLVKQLSGGMKRRLMIAKALVHNPKILLLDEPTAGVDIELRTSLWDFVRELQKEGMSILLTTHYLQEAEELCGRIGIISEGNLRYVGQTRGIIHELTRKTVEVQVKHPNPESLRLSAHYKSERENYFIYSVPYNMTVGELLTELRIPMSDLGDIITREGNLEDAFLSVLHQKSEASV